MQSSLEDWESWFRILESCSASRTLGIGGNRECKHWTRLDSAPLPSQHPRSLNSFLTGLLPGP